MTEDDPPDQISEIEQQIEAFAKEVERCRHFILASKVAIGCGVASLLVAVLGLFGAGLSAFLGSIALMLGGIVSFGSNINTLRQAEVSLIGAKMLRSRLIREIDFRQIRDTPLKLM